MTKNNKDIECIDVPWESKVIMICEKCDQQAERIKNELKVTAKAEFGKKVRILNTSCLGICPDKKIAVALVDKNATNTYAAFEVEPSISSSDLYTKLLK